MNMVPPGDAGAVAGTPVCPRHPDRESYVRCQRCERPVCPQCQRPAAVGIQCVDCVRQQGKSVRRPRTVFGGEAVDSPPMVTYGIIGICVGVYVLQLVLGNDFTDSYGYWPAGTLLRPWTMLTGAFLHSPSFYFHIVFNLYAVWMIGPYLESLLGHLRFAAIYLVCAFGGSVGVLLILPPSRDGAWNNVTVGASGAIFGLFAVLLLVNRRLGRDSAGIIGVIVINGAIGFWPGLNIAWQAHLGGLVTGALAAAVLVYSPQERRSVLHPLGLAAVAVLLLALTLVKVALVPAGYFA
jgi:membrane associated rhomboid family serine protease